MNKLFNKTLIKRINRQIFAIIEKDIFLELRVKANIITRFLSPLIQFFLYFFLFGIIFNVADVQELGYWNANNYLIFLFLAFCIQLSRTIINRYYQLFLTEKYWKTLSSLMVAPLNRYTLLISVLISEMVMISIPLLIFFIITWVFSPIFITYFILSILMFFSIYLVFASIGLIIGVLGISKEEYVKYSFIFVNIILLLGCINYPIEIFPEFIQIFILLNPLYYLFDLFRLIWYMGINFDLAISFITPIHVIISVLITIITPLLSVYLFDRIYKKHGITGY